MIWDNISTSKLNWMLEGGSLIQNKLISPKIQSPKFQGQLGKKASDRKDRLTSKEILSNAEKRAERYSYEDITAMNETRLHTGSQVES